MRFLAYIVMSLLCVQYATAQYKVDRLLLSGRIALHYEDYVLSIQYFNQAISQKPYLWEPWQLRAVAKYFLDDWQGASADATKAIELNPYITPLYDLRGISNIRQGNYANAIADYTKAISLEPNNQNYWYNRAVCYLESEDYDAALMQLDTIISKWKTNAMPYIMKAQVLMHKKDTVAAETWIDKSLEVNQYNADAWRVKAFLAMKDSKWVVADSLFSKAIHLKPKSAECYANRANVRLKLNNLRGAMSDYDTALELAPNDILSHYNRGLLRLQVGDDNRAIEDFDYVLKLEPNNIMALFNRATLLDRIGELKAAIRDYTKVINKFPNFWTGLRYRAACYRRLGMTAQAEKDEFKVLKAQMDKHLGIQQRWSRKKLSSMRKLSDIDPEKYNDIVVNDEIEEEHDYKSEYRGKIQNHQVSQDVMPYIALTVGEGRSGLTTYSPFDKDMETVLQHLRMLSAEAQILAPHLGEVKENGVSTLDMVENLTEAIKKAKNSADAELLMLQRSVAYSSALDFQEALKDIDIYLSAHPESVVAVWQRAVCNAMLVEFAPKATPLENSMRAAGVKSDFKKLLRLSPNSAFAYYCYGTFCLRIGDYSEATELLGKAVEADPTLPYAYYNRGLAYMRLDDYQQATSNLGKAGELGLYKAYSLMKATSKREKQNIRHKTKK